MTPHADAAGGAGPDPLEPVGLLRDLVAIPSLSGQEGAAVAFLIAAARRAGIPAHRDGAGNFVAEVGDGPTTHVLLGHIDTVPGEIPVRLVDGELWGRGTVDAKGPLVAFLCAARRAGAAPGHRVVVIGAVEEEAASSKGAWHVRERYRPANTVIGEPSGSAAITLGYKGRLLARFELEQAKVHSAVPAPTPVERAVALWEATREHARTVSAGRPLFESLQPSLDEVETLGTAFTAGVRARIGFRLPPDCDVEGLKKRMQESAGPGRLSFEGEVPAYRAAKTTPVVKAFLATLRERGMDPGFRVKTGTSDMNVLGPAWGPSIVTYGPGDASLDHTPGERIAVDELLRGVDVLTGVLRRLTGR